MKLKRWHLYATITLCFIIIFVSINRKYDRFYRVNGINNDNRALIAMYLDANEQDYLVEKGIAVDEFIKYIAVPDFNLPYYEYYNILNNAKIFSDLNTLITQGNIIASHLETTYEQHAFSYCKQLISNKLVLAFVNQPDFKFDNIQYYQQVRSLYGDSDYTYVKDTNSYIDALITFGIKQDELINVIKMACDNYNKESLNVLLMTPLDPTIKRVYNPNNPGVVVNNTTYIGSFGPKNIVLADKINRENYSIILEKNAYDALLTMFNDLKQSCNGFVLEKAYRSYELLMANPTISADVPGYNEYQLGTTINVKKENYSIVDFAETDVYQWLIDNSYKHGYILRYPLAKEAVTNHPYSSNVFRFVGIELAKELHDKNITLEEYQTSKDN